MADTTFMNTYWSQARLMYQRIAALGTYQTTINTDGGQFSRLLGIYLAGGGATLQ